MHTLGSFNFTKRKEADKKLFTIEQILKDLDVSKVLLLLEGEEIFLDIKEILMFEKYDDLVSSNQIIQRLDSLSSYRFSIVSSITELKSTLNETKLDLELWENQTKSGILNVLASSSQSRLTDKQLHMNFIQNSKNLTLYEAKNKTIFSLEALIYKLSTLDEILRQRIEVLRSIMKRND